MIIRKLRLSNGWSQEQLAELCNLSVRTIQRVEKGKKPSLETLNSLASVLKIDVSELSAETISMDEKTKLSVEEEKAVLYVRGIKGFYNHLIKYLIVIFCLLVLNVIKSPHYLWVFWPALGWGIGVLFHGLKVFEVFNFFGPDWEKRQIEKRITR